MKHNHNIELLHRDPQEAVDFTAADYNGPHSGALISAFTHEKQAHAEDNAALVLDEKMPRLQLRFGREGGSGGRLLARITTLGRNFKFSLN